MLTERTSGPESVIFCGYIFCSWCKIALVSVIDRWMAMATSHLEYLFEKQVCEPMEQKIFCSHVIQRKLKSSGFFFFCYLFIFY